MTGLICQLLTAQAGLKYEVAERQHLEEKFQSLLELIPQALVIVNEQERIVVTNSQMEELFGYSQPKIVGGRVEDLLHEHCHAPYRQYRADALAKRSRGNPLDLFGLR